jgi:lipoyl(octanoyl) transferase
VDTIEWRVSDGLTDYAQALAEMELRAGAVPAELVDARFPVIPAGRGGRYTYHGPGQRVGYLVLDLGKRGRDVRRFVHSVEGWVIAALAEVGITAFRAPGRIGIWTLDRDAREAKIGAIGVRVRRWVTLHGFSVNLSPDLSHFGGIVPCGLADHPVASAAALGHPVSSATFDAALTLTRHAFLTSLTCNSEMEA